MLVTERDEVAALDAGAIFSPCRRWRYLLWRRWDESLPVMALVGLNPSTADELKDDPTIRRCVGFAKSWGFGSLHMLNLFAYRSTSPLLMRAQGATALGPRNNEYIMGVTRDAQKTIAAWGAHGVFRGREQEVRKMLAEAHIVPEYIKLTQTGAPGHPLYLRADLQPTPWPYVDDHR